MTLSPWRFLGLCPYPVTIQPWRPWGSSGVEGGTGEALVRRAIITFCRVKGRGNIWHAESGWRLADGRPKVVQREHHILYSKRPYEYQAWERRMKAGRRSAGGSPTSVPSSGSSVDARCKCQVLPEHYPKFLIFLQLLARFLMDR
jgi:hypothetical protein